MSNNSIYNSIGALNYLVAKVESPDLQKRIQKHINIIDDAVSGVEPNDHKYDAYVDDLETSKGSE